MKILALNKEARRNYQIDERLEAGLVLQGWEVKSIRLGRVQLRGSFVRIKEGEAYWFNGFVGKYQQARSEMDEKRSRKLLLHKRELKRLKELQNAQGQHLVPTAIGLKGPNIKLEIGVGRSKRATDKRQNIKARDDQRRAAGAQKDFERR